MKRIIILVILCAGFGIEAMNGPGQPQLDQPQEEWCDAAKQCYIMLRKLWDLGKNPVDKKNAPNIFVRNAWDYHYHKYLERFNVIEEPNKKQKAPSLDVQIQYFMLKDKIKNRIAQAPIEMLAKTHWKIVVAGISTTAAVAVPLTYVASSEVYKRVKGKGAPQELEDDHDEQKNLEEVCTDGCEPEEAAPLEGK